MAEQSTEVYDMAPPLVDNLLTRDHAQVKTPAYVRDTDAARKRSGAAERMAKMRERKKNAGLSAVELPAEVAAAIRAGGFESWLDLQRIAQPRTVEVPVDREVIREVVRVERVEVPFIVEKPVEKRAELSEKDRKSVVIGRAVQKSGFALALLKLLRVI